MRKPLAIISICGFLLAGCDSGDINISPVTNDERIDSSVNNSNNTTTTPVQDVNPCASYANSGGQTIQGDFDGVNCEYSPAFADAGNNIKTDMTIPALENGGVHIVSRQYQVRDHQSRLTDFCGRHC
jgi:hypothetical protein